MALMDTFGYTSLIVTFQGLFLTLLYISYIPCAHAVSVTNLFLNRWTVQSRWSRRTARAEGVRETHLPPTLQHNTCPNKSNLTVQTAKPANLNESFSLTSTPTPFVWIFLIKVHFPVTECSFWGTWPYLITPSELISVDLRGRNL